MQIVVNHVTRMQTDERICVAGIDAETFENVRPVTPKTDLITRRLLRENGGPFGPGALVELGDVEPCPSPPETEDHRFETAAASHVEDRTDDEYLALLEEVRKDDIPTAFGPALIEVRPGKLAVKAGGGTCSLAVLQVADPVLHVKFDKLYMKFGPTDTQVELRVTDVRFYEPDHHTIRHLRMNDVNARIADGIEAYMMLGLAQRLYDATSGLDLHWLMANGICLADRAVSDIP
jgi:hypothetical protein